jgi:hypothetical protein
MIAWTTEAEALGYATSRLEDATDHLSQPEFRDGVALALGALAEAVAALVLVKHTRRGDALVTIDQLAADLVDTRAAQPRRSCCQTYGPERHAPGCQRAPRMAAGPDRSTIIPGPQA